MRSKKTRRRGVLLLIVLSLLVLFVVAGLSFSVLTGSFRRSTQHLQKQGRTGDPPQQLLDGALLQLLRGPGPQEPSVLRGHDLLNDLYGNDDFTVTCDRAVLYQPDPNQPAFPSFVYLTTAPAGADLDVIPGHYNGSVITFLGNHAFRGTSARIVEFDIKSNAQGSYLAIVAELPESIPSSRVGELANAQLLFNGRPFNGTGAGLGTGTSILKLDETFPAGSANRPLALLPNALATVGANPERGGMDESYDAADFQNMFLAWMPPAPGSSSDVIPSFHRPELLNYWDWDWSQSPPTSGKLATEPDLLRAVLLRPNPLDHPNFTGSNPNLSTNLSAQVQQLIGGSSTVAGSTTNYWDVDNDMDGVPDSIWVDLGFPVQTMPDGRNYKPLFAILCVDLDSRVNLNVHGSMAHAINPPSGYKSGFKESLDSQPGFATIAAFPVATDVLRPDVSKGLGFGPAEIHIGALFSHHDGTSTVTPNPDTDLDADIVNRLLSARIDGPGGVVSGATAADDKISLWTMAGYPDRWFDMNDQVQLSSSVGRFGSPLDLFGRGTVMINHAGQPVYFYTGTSELDDPYEVNLLSPQAGDPIYTDEDLENLLRDRDYDSPILVGRFDNRSGWNSTLWDEFLTHSRGLVTTRSFAIPTPNVVSADSPFSSIERRFRDVLANNSTLSPSDIADQLELMLAPELRRGEKFNLNRLMGTDETNIYTYDRQVFARHLFSLLMFIKNPDVFIDFDGTIPGVPPTLADQLESARGLAQWCVNVIDFRDADSIMTPFEYDPNPFDGWDADGDLTTNELDNQPAEPSKYVVWGCERPELLITETLAFHDRRTEDLDDEITETGVQPAMMNHPQYPDGDFDQRMRPRGSLFVELYNPWLGHSARPEELGYFGATQDHVNPAGVRLDAVTPNGDPVWRIVVTKVDNNHVDPDAPTFNPSLIERYIYFANVMRSQIQRDDPWVASHSQLAAIHFRNVTGAGTRIAPIAPGRYAVIGPEGVAEPLPPNRTGYTTTIGFLTTTSTSAANPTIALDRANTRRIQLIPEPFFVGGGSNPVGNTQVWVANILDGADSPPNVPIQPAAAVVIESATFASADPQTGFITLNSTEPRSLSISEPVAGYPDSVTIGSRTLNYDRTRLDGEGAYVEGATIRAMDVPLDDLAFPDPQPGFGPPPQRVLGSTHTFRIIHLQRLANPMANWHRSTNPYRTIDSASVDLTVFNGLVSQSDAEQDNVLVDPNVQGVQFESLERGDWERRLAQPGQPIPRTFWRHEPPRTQFSPSVPESTLTHHFNFPLFHSLGHLNTAYQNDGLISAADPNQLPFVGQPNAISEPPFPWLVWNNRPFASHLELLQVPYTSSSELLRRFSLPQPGSGIYDQPQNPFVGAQSVFGHLLNFARRERLLNGESANSGLVALLDYVTAAVSFEGSDRWFSRETVGFQEPFNRLSRFRRPGLININTITDERIWQAISFGNPATYDLWSEVVKSRRGFGTSADPMEKDQNFPTRFANPFRAASNAAYLPELHQNQSATWPIQDPTNPSVVDPIFATMLRPRATGTSLFDPGLEMLFDTSNAFTSGIYNHPSRNSHFRHHGLQRLGNLVTNHSNCFAVWITVGYFEVTPWTDINAQLPNPTGNIHFDTAHPDGWQLGQEIGFDLGKSQRHRAFYILDRSIPVGYETGKDHNVRGTVVLERQIE